MTTSRRNFTKTCDARRTRAVDEHVRSTEVQELATIGHEEPEATTPRMLCHTQVDSEDNDLEHCIACNKTAAAAAAATAAAATVGKWQ